VAVLQINGLVFDESKAVGLVGGGLGPPQTSFAPLVFFKSAVLFLLPVARQRQQAAAHTFLSKKREVGGGGGGELSPPPIAFVHVQRFMGGALAPFFLEPCSSTHKLRRSSGLKPTASALLCHN
jgi:hypothetical protein